MPNQNGDDATAALRALGMSVPVIGLTGDAHPDDIESFLAKGATEVLTKPVPRAVLQTVLARYLSAQPPGVT